MASEPIYFVVRVVKNLQNRYSHEVVEMRGPDIGRHVDTYPTERQANKMAEELNAAFMKGVAYGQTNPIHEGQQQ